jgi:Uncharacterized protein conserved in bacteria (DUF2255)
VRRYNGQASRWYQAAARRKAGRIIAAGRTKEVAFEPVDGPVNDLVDAAYRAKYDGSPYLSAMIGARAATVEIMPVRHARMTLSAPRRTSTLGRFDLFHMLSGMAAICAIETWDDVSCRREGDVADRGLERLNWADSGHSLLRPEGAVARKERTFLGGASQDSLQPQYQ